MALPTARVRVRTAALLAIIACVSACTTAPPLSGGRAGGATAIPAPVAPAPPVVITGPAAAPPLPAEAETRPLAPPPVIATITSDTIALVLPLESPTYAQAAEAIKSGFLAAANRAQSAARIRVIGHGDDGVLPAFAAATELGAALVVGPLTRDDLKTVAAMALARPRMLALNQADDGAPLPDDAYALTLSVDSDAALLALVARDRGIHALAVVASDAPLQKRFAAAFVAMWNRSGGPPPREYRFDPNLELLGMLRRELAARPPEAVVLAVDGGEAALARSFLPPGPVYAVSQITDDMPVQMLRDLEGARYIEIPWLADPDNSAFAGVPRPNAGNPLFERLYALGLDAFALAQMLAEPVPPDRIEIDGATGHLSLTPSKSFLREGLLMLIHDGRALPESTAR